MDFAYIDTIYNQDHTYSDLNLSNQPFYSVECKLGISIDHRAVTSTIDTSNTLIDFVIAPTLEDTVGT